MAGYTSDLLSDVIGHCPEDSVLITVQNHKNTVAVCTLVGAVAILVTHNREIPPDMLQAATAEQVAILRTPLDQFHATCLIASALGT
jgi:predicted transcriptional regulator